jgi:alpha-1,6-mannosyltransferase
MVVSVSAVTAGVAGVVLVAGIPHSPITPILPTGAGPLAPFRWAARVTGLASISPGDQALVAVVALLVAGATFLIGLRQAWLGAVPIWVVIATGLLFHVIAVALPLLISHDVYSYALYGRIAAIHHANPYVQFPDAFRSDQLFRFVSAEWRDTPAVYGPAFINLSALLVRLVHGTAGLILLFKVISGVASAATMLIVARLATSLWPARASFAVALFAWNPIVLFDTVGGGHMDSLIALLVVSAFALLVAGRRRLQSWGSPFIEFGVTATLTLAALLKPPAALPLILFVAAAVWNRPARRRVGALAMHLGVVAAVTAPFAVPFAERANLTFGLTTLVGVQNASAPSGLFALAFGGLGRAVGGPGLEQIMALSVRLTFTVAFVGAFVLIVKHVASRAETLSTQAMGAAWGWTILIFLLTAPILFPWYLVWMLPVAWLLPKLPRWGAVVLCSLFPLSYVLAEKPASIAEFNAVIAIGVALVTPMFFLVLGLLIGDLSVRLRSGLALELEDVGKGLLGGSRRLPEGRVTQARSTT